MPATPCASECGLASRQLACRRRKAGMSRSSSSLLCGVRSAGSTPLRRGCAGLGRRGAAAPAVAARPARHRAAAADDALEQARAGLALGAASAAAAGRASAAPMRLIGVAALTGRLHRARARRNGVARHFGRRTLGSTAGAAAHALLRRAGSAIRPWLDRHRRLAGPAGDRRRLVLGGRQRSPALRRRDRRGRDRSAPFGLLLGRHGPGARGAARRRARRLRRRCRWRRPRRASARPSSRRRSSRR